ncbi:putative sarcosine-dimethylglycine methyltransferase [Plesiocystis pacifica SIR-1]|uniref:Putative sarcosine-dimethylglycine methyltransferase n=1 Tax=Plesiocystis pacifica SIR-1 TaxID=391625 RepID=A6GGK0_9BACT|nr:hypothetical protein [Plesiocystis pacifica]EDM75026.1 putative sarcosine-dimethylglycine methyltransferase [Plesiocystis pacifica SIR-1]
MLEQTRAEHARLGGVSPEYIERTCAGLGHWIEGGAQGDLCWGLFHMRETGEGAGLGC